jgi:endonuclease-3
VQVNKVTPALFKRYPTPETMAMANPVHLENLVRSTGFYRNKAKNLKAMAQQVVEEFAGQVPDQMEQLLSLPGVARKTANVVLGDWFKRAEGIVVDTHVKRISRLLSLTPSTQPPQIERDLMALLPRKEWIGFPHRLILLGREICIARRPKCPLCPLNDCCPSAVLT